jgi:hypothetical protein
MVFRISLVYNVIQNSGAMETNKEKLVRMMKTAVEDLLNYSFTEFQRKLPYYVNRSFGYGLLNNLFVRNTGITLKDYFFKRKKEKASELTDYYRLTDLEVAYQLGFRSISAMIKTIRSGQPTHHKIDYSKMQARYA